MAFLVDEVVQVNREQLKDSSISHANHHFASIVSASGVLGMVKASYVADLSSFALVRNKRTSGFSHITMRTEKAKSGNFRDHRVVTITFIVIFHFDCIAMSNLARYSKLISICNSVICTYLNSVKKIIFISFVVSNYRASRVHHHADNHSVITTGNVKLVNKHFSTY